MIKNTATPEPQPSTGEGFGASDCSEFIDATKNLLSKLIVPIMQSADYGTPGKIIGWRCLVCNHDGSQVDFDHDPQCSFQMVINAIPNMY